MKKSFTLLSLLVIIVSGQAQLRVAVLGGPHSASVKETNSLPGWNTKVKPFYTSRSGLNLGFLANLPLNESGNLALQPGFFFMSKGRKFQQVFDTTVTKTDTLNYKSNFFTNYIDIPFNFTLKLPMSKKAKFFLSAGPYVSFFFSGKINSELLVAPTDTSLKFSKSDDEIEVGKGTHKAKTFDFGINGRVGFELGNVIISGFYSQGLSNFFQADYDGTFKHQVIGASVGFWLNKSQPAAPKAPKDKDKDGVPDDQDACPTLPGSALTRGCPDKDGDGIADQVDKCPSEPGVAAYNGCPVPDTDKDGVNDLADKCPNEAGPASNNGCPLPKPEPDTDGDGVIDKEDQCPTEAGPKDYKGCPVPVIKEDVLQKINYAARNIQFQKGSIKLDASSYPALNEVADALKKYPKLRLSINGYTDNSGSATANQQLSQKRADAVKKYLNEKGIAADRLSAKGHGPANPIADNKTPAGQIKNRRVELNLESQ
ncbi:OmpA family protein [Paraflavitalea sp. CAU 1676]|uniref:OmpA family protein n=1 Tax=Paraflavitalea sp. CAU 1676 TaxID=3032598 RepID=UPI0023DB94F6|nr:OmpA family protein [Paraflavitalea sp. CAU 1676]MDF2192636.1 OmpA family protein [Paraflavitalea sp. CAU 1676]